VGAGGAGKYPDRFVGSHVVDPRPLLTHERCLREALALPFRDQQRFDKFVAANAQRLFFS
jgi:hypothetical protein